MHMADALISPAVGGTMYVASAAAAAYSIKIFKDDDNTSVAPVMGVMGAFVFAAQMINFTIPGTGSSGHVCGGMLLSAILGPYAGFMTMIGVLFIQALLFADGGLLALGCNIWNMAFYGCFLGTVLIWMPIMKKGCSKKRIVAASVLGCIITLQLGAFSVCIETMCSDITALPFGLFAATMQPIHLAIGLIEGLITAAVLCFIYDARPELLYGVKTEAGIRHSFRMTLAVLAVSALLIGGGLSLFASDHPDGLEWSIEKVAGDTVPGADSGIHSKAAKLQDETSVLPDYGFKNGTTDFGTSISGVTGSGIVFALCIGGCYALRYRNRKRKIHE